MLTPDRLLLDTVAAANKVIAVSNEHPLLQRFGVYFCAPGDTDKPDLYKLFTTRLFSSKEYVGDSDRPRLAWMKRLRCPNDDTWPLNAPSPEELYDFCSAIHPVFSIEVRKWEAPSEPDWNAWVQFFEVSHADRFQQLVNERREVLGWTA